MGEQTTTEKAWKKGRVQLTKSPLFLSNISSMYHIEQTDIIDLPEAVC